MTTTYDIGGMSCGGCVNAVKRALETTLVDVRVDVDLESQRVTVTGDHQPTDVRDAIVDAGFEFNGPSAPPDLSS